MSVYQIFCYKTLQEDDGKSTDILLSKKHIHRKFDYNSRVFTDPLKLIQVPPGKNGARLYLKYFVVLNVGFRNKVRKSGLRINVKTQTQFINLLIATKDISLESLNTLFIYRHRC